MERNNLDADQYRVAEPVRPGQALAVDKRPGGGAGTEGEGVLKTFDGGALAARRRPCPAKSGFSPTASSRPRSWRCNDEFVPFPPGTKDARCCGGDKCLS